MACRSLLNASGAPPEQGWLHGASTVAGGSRDEHTRATPGEALGVSRGNSGFPWKWGEAVWEQSSNLGGTALCCLGVMDCL